MNELLCYYRVTWHVFRFHIPPLTGAVVLMSNNDCSGFCEDFSSICHVAHSANSHCTLSIACHVQGWWTGSHLMKMSLPRAYKIRFFFTKSRTWAMFRVLLNCSKKPWHPRPSLILFLMKRDLSFYLSQFKIYWFNHNLLKGVLSLCWVHLYHL